MESQLSRFNAENQILQNLVLKIRKWRPFRPTGAHHNHVSEGELHTRNAFCEKNPGHTNFIPLDTFTLEHLPEGQRDNVLYEYIKAVADLTVKVNIYMVSPHRPEFWPKTNDPYPFYNMREQEVLRTGSGMIYFVDQYTDGVNQYGDEHDENFTKCWCRKCEHSDSPSNVWWEFDVVTATHMVFDDIEASHTTLRLFYDSKDSPVVIVDKASVVDANIEDDKCRLKCVTCYKNLGDKLDRIMKHYADIWAKIQNKFKNCRAAKKLTFIVSHPHGCTKQVSVGRWIMKQKVGKKKIKFTYKTCTCPGSSGAVVHCIGTEELWSRWWRCNHLVHSGTEHNDNHNEDYWRWLFNKFFHRETNSIEYYNYSGNCW